MAHPAVSKKTAVIGVTACLRNHEGWDWHSVQEKYVRAVTDAMGLEAVILPSLAPKNLPALIERLDGILFTGSPSNVLPSYYQGPASREGVLHDPARDALTMPLIPMAVESAVPIFGICRGFQEINVAMGGTLFQHLEEQPGRFDHRAPKDKSHEEQYAPAHKVRLMGNGWLRGLIGRDEIMVNSLHGQGIDQLAPRLIKEAEAEDGTVEAVRIADSPAFAFAVQWHPEWKAQENHESMRLFSAFKEAALARASKRR